MDIFNELVGTLKAVNSNVELWDELAKCYKNAYDALCRAGFSPSQAMEIISRQGTGFKQ